MPYYFSFYDDDNERLFYANTKWRNHAFDLLDEDHLENEDPLENEVD
jgi:hypothetical protein